jgi:hypothetical protein
MTRNESTICDGCKCNLTQTNNCVGYRLLLCDERIPPVSVALTLMSVVPHLDGSKHFCDLGCLTQWVIALAP